MKSPKLCSNETSQCWPPSLGKESKAKLVITTARILAQVSEMPRAMFSSREDISHLSIIWLQKRGVGGPCFLLLASRIPLPQRTIPLGPDSTLLCVVFVGQKSFNLRCRLYTIADTGLWAQHPMRLTFYYLYCTVVFEEQSEMSTVPGCKAEEETP